MRVLRHTAICVILGTSTLGAQRGSGAMQEANRLDLAGETVKARAIFQSIIDTATAPAAKAAAQRGMALSYGFDGDCLSAVKYERMVMAYWQTREEAEPQNAFYQQGEMANEAARICIDVGMLDIAEIYYSMGTALGIKEPLPATHSRALWDFRLHHALARIAARRGNSVEAHRQLASARSALESGDSTMRAQQGRFLPYLAGYIALYTNDLATAERELGATVAIRGNDTDPFMRLLLAMTYEKLGRRDEANAAYDKALSLATAHNPPSAHVHYFMKQRRSARR